MEKGKPLRQQNLSDNYKNADAIFGTRTSFAHALSAVQWTSSWVTSFLWYPGLVNVSICNKEVKNRPYWPSSKNSYFQREASCKTFHLLYNDHFFLSRRTVHTLTLV